MIDMAKAKKTARTLLRANRKSDVSWRCISKSGYRLDGIEVKPGINHATLCRFAKAKGTWIPNIETQKLLGIYKERKPYPKHKTIRDLNPKELRQAVRGRTLPFVLGWLKGQPL